MATRTEQRPAGVLEAGGILDRIVDRKAARLAEVMAQIPLEALMAQVEQIPQPARGFAQSLKREGAINIIAEVKQRSPSKGVIRADFDPLAIARSYEQAGAAAISVLCEADYFGGSLDHLRAIRARTAMPLLRKDFLFDDYHLYEARAAGADAVLLIVAVLDDALLRRLLEQAAAINLDALVEVHTADEMRRAVSAGATIIGVNNRDLTTFKVDLQTSLDLAPLAPAAATLVSESGISDGASIRRLRDAGYDAFLIGETFMRAESPGAALQQLIGEAGGESSPS
ncbi:MAG TPA: indole-3-glycerol phosphate synthase TrpC [Blastocatellia bacterium]|nr:indole-3-glycerol phosphate synthase TrpC [Blastocatellia bacterium]